jgi:hypothetical protein
MAQLQMLQHSKMYPSIRLPRIPDRKTAQLWIKLPRSLYPLRQLGALEMPAAALGTLHEAVTPVACAEQLGDIFKVDMAVAKLLLAALAELQEQRMHYIQRLAVWVRVVPDQALPLHRL